MDNSELLTLIDKYLNGNATPTEKEKLFAYYERMQASQSWNEELMGNQDEVGKRIYCKVEDQIDKQDLNSTFKIWRIAATIAIIISVGILGLKFFTGTPGTNKSLNYQTLTATNHILKIYLEDGTHIWLNSGSRLRYPEKFAKGIREVILDGEAYFDVAHQSRPFIIRSGKVVTQVLGTSFNIQAYAADEISKVSVVSGKVGVTVPGKRQNRIVFLTRNQQIAFNRQSNNLNKTTIADASVATAWMHNKIRFRNTPFSEVITELERIYKVHINYQQSLKACPVFADFNCTDNAAKVLNMLARSLAGRVSQQKANTYFLAGSPCN